MEPKVDLKDLDDSLIVVDTTTNPKRWTVDMGTGDDTVTASSGNDNIKGGTGDDSLDGGAGDDALQGNAGRDVLKGGLGVDQFSGGDGSDGINSSDGIADDPVFCGSGRNDSAAIDLKDPQPAGDCESAPARIAERATTSESGAPSSCRPTAWCPCV